VLLGNEYIHVSLFVEALLSCQHSPWLQSQVGVALEAVGSIGVDCMVQIVIAGAPLRKLLKL
jgi:hypothetical protein